MRRRFWTIEIRKCRLSYSRPYIVLHCWPDLDLENVEDRMRRQLLIEAVQRTDHFLNIFSDGSQFHMRRGLNLSPNKRSKHEATVREHTFIAIGEYTGEIFNHHTTVIFLRVYL